MYKVDDSLICQQLAAQLLTHMYINCLLLRISSNCSEKQLDGFHRKRKLRRQSAFRFPKTVCRQWMIYAVAPRIGCAQPCIHA